MNSFFVAHNMQKNQKAWIFLGLLALGVMLASFPAAAQSARETDNRLNRLENEIQTLSRTIYKGEAPPVGSGSAANTGTQANTEVRLQQMETDLRDLRGRLEEQGHEIRQLRAQLERALSDIEMRLTDAGSGIPAADQGAGYGQENGSRPAPYTASTPSQNSAAAPGYQWSSSGQDSVNASAGGGQLGTLSSSGAASSADAAAAQYENAFSLLKNAQYDAAEQEFLSFISGNPGHALTGNAKYWLGETYYVRGEFEKAARVFAEGYQVDPKGSKAADNLLKLGMSLSGTGNSADACIALGQLQNDFPNGSAPVLRRAQQEMKRLGCS